MVKTLENLKDMNLIKRGQVCGRMIKTLQLTILIGLKLLNKLIISFQSTRLTDVELNMRLWGQAIYMIIQLENRLVIFFYIIIKIVVGHGAYANVKLAISKKENERFAIKIYDKFKLMDP